MVSMLLRCVYRAMRDGVTEMVPLLEILPVSKNGGRWEGETGSTAMCWEREEKWVTYKGYIQHWNDGDRGVVGEYESLLLRACQHVLRGFDP